MTTFTLYAAPTAPTVARQTIPGDATPNPPTLPSFQDISIEHFPGHFH